jgi:hypothetical protein
VKDRPMGLKQTSPQASAATHERSAHALGAKYEGFARRRWVLIAIHGVLGLATAFAWLSRQDFYQLRYARFLFRDLPAAYALAAAWPYLLSATLCYRATSITRLGALIFFAILLAGTLVAGAAYLRVSRDHLLSSLVVLSLGQGVLFACAARYLTKA